MVNVCHKRCDKGETKEETKKSVSSNTAQAISGRILVADDDKWVRGVLYEALEFMGFEVALAGNGIEALDVFAESSFDLVLTDLHMPAMDGLSLAGHIKKKSPSTPVILVAGCDRKTFGRSWKVLLLTQSYSNPLHLKIFKGQSKERWRQQNENMDP
jgi:CheY-like chemotaxis protein